MRKITVMLLLLVLPIAVLAVRDDREEKTKMEKAIFGAGCFWHVQEAFDKIKGIKTTVGYTGGKVKEPNYKLVCSNTTGHVEAVQIEYDPAKVTYAQLLAAFWDMHDPTTLNRQGPDVGFQYRSVIFYHNEAQKEAAIKSIEARQKTGKYKNRIVTEVLPAKEFWPAEDYHQKYFKKNGVPGIFR